MAGTVGGVTCWDVVGVLPSPEQRVETYTRRGIDGTGIRHLGQAAAPFRVQCVQLSNSAGIESWYGWLHSLVGLVVPITTSRGQTKTQCLIEAVSTPRMIPAYNGAVTTRGDVVITGRVLQ